MVFLEQIYLVVVLAVLVFALHRLYLAMVFWRSSRDWNEGAKNFENETLPFVTVQLPIYNEKFVVERLLDSCLHLEYPRNQLEIQILDDSTDETSEIIDRWLKKNATCTKSFSVIRRGNRSGYKAGALQEGLFRSKGEFLAVFDADFVIPHDFLLKAMTSFRDPHVGMVQARWGYLNQDESQLTRVQSLMLDGHFFVEHWVRFRLGYCFNFNGTAGVWRKQAILSSGGWSAQTLTEDLDLSYRAQIRGWRFVYRPDIRVPSELPGSIPALKGQQYRWAKGSAQTAKKTLWPLFQSKLTLRQKIEATFHLTTNTVYVFIFLLAILGPFVMVLRSLQNPGRVFFFDFFILNLATIALVLFFFLVLREGNHGKRGISTFLQLLALGTGLSLNNGKAVLSGFFGKVSVFLRTPKTGDASKISKEEYLSEVTPGFWIELAMALYLGLAFVILASWGNWYSLPYLLLMAAGYSAVGFSSLRHFLRNQRSFRKVHANFAS